MAAYAHLHLGEHDPHHWQHHHHRLFCRLGQRGVLGHDQTPHQADRRLGQAAQIWPDRACHGHSVGLAGEHRWQFARAHPVHWHVACIRVQHRLDYRCSARVPGHAARAHLRAHFPGPADQARPQHGGQRRGRLGAMHLHCAHWRAHRLRDCDGRLRASYSWRSCNWGHQRR